MSEIGIAGAAIGLVAVAVGVMALEVMVIEGRLRKEVEELQERVVVLERGKE